MKYTLQTIFVLLILTGCQNRQSDNVPINGSANKQKDDSLEHNSGQTASKADQSLYFLREWANINFKELSEIYHGDQQKDYGITQQDIQNGEILKNRIIKLVGQEIFDYYFGNYQPNIQPTVKDDNYYLEKCGLLHEARIEPRIKDDCYIELSSKCYNDLVKELVLIADIKNNKIQIVLFDGSNKKYFAEEGCLFTVRTDVFPITKVWKHSSYSAMDMIINNTSTTASSTSDMQPATRSSNTNMTSEISTKLEYAKMAGDEMRKKYSAAREAYLNENSPGFGNDRAMSITCNFVFGEMKGLRNNLLNYYDKNRSDFDPTLTNKLKYIMDDLDGWIAVKEEELKLINH